MTSKPKQKFVPASLTIDPDYIPNDPPPVSTPTVHSMPPTPAWTHQVDYGVDWAEPLPSPPPSPKAPVEPLRAAFIGAGGINFGGAEGPWDHASRLEKMPDLCFSAVVDVNIELAKKRINDRQNGENPECNARWEKTVAFADYMDMLESPSCPDIVFVGLPPPFHGALEGKAAVELECARRGVHVFVEKPISIRPVAEVLQLAEELEKLQKEKGVIVSVGYMLRYSPAVDTAMQILRETKCIPTAVIARYCCAYQNIPRPDWWDKRRSGGPVVEQATHFVDLMRYFGGEVERDSVQAMCVSPQSKLGQLSEMPAAPGGDHTIPMEHRVSRITSAQFRYESGAIGQLTHGVMLHGNDYCTEIEVWADGLRIIIRDPYNNPQLHVRKPGSDVEELVELPCFDKYTHADMYMVEAACFIHAVRTKDETSVRSPFRDSIKTYELTQIITERGL